jgi:HD-GYP domain-containing protein (c-di-GMP phosphodiesterase class II)
MAEKYSFARCRIHQLRPGLEIAESILSPDGGVLLHEGTILTERQIQLLTIYDVDSVRVRLTVQSTDQEARSEKTAMAPELENFAGAQYCEPDIAATAAEHENEFLHIYNNAVRDLKKSFTMVRLEKHLDCDLLHSIADSLISLAAVRGIAATALLNTATRSEDYLFHHSVNVGILASIIGRLSGAFNELQQKSLVLAGILHDLGKLEIPVQVLYKSGQLTEEELNTVRQHPAIAFKFFRSYKEITDPVRYGVLQHHERDDGSGYPLRTGAAKNHPIAKVLGIADVYDAMTSKKVYGVEVSPFVAIDTIQADTFSGKFSPQYSTPFLHELCQTLIGRYVMLNDGRTGQLVFWNRSGKENCLVRFSDGQVLDVSSQNQLRISKLVC